MDFEAIFCFYLLLNHLISNLLFELICFNSLSNVLKRHFALSPCPVPHGHGSSSSQPYSPSFISLKTIGLFYNFHDLIDIRGVLHVQLNIAIAPSSKAGNISADTVRIDYLRELHVQRNTKPLLLEDAIHKIGIQLISNVQLLNLSIPAPIEPPVRIMRATIPAAQSHYSGTRKS